MLDGRSRPDRAARFYARFGITEAQFKSGVPGFLAPDFWEGVPGRVAFKYPVRSQAGTA